MRVILLPSIAVYSDAAHVMSGYTASYTKNPGYGCSGPIIVNCIHPPRNSRGRSVEYTVLVLLFTGGARYKMLSLPLTLQFLLLTVVGVDVVVCQVCEFIPGPITPSNETAVITMDCNEQQRDVGIANTAGDNADLVVYLYSCITVGLPVGMFVNVSASLSTVTVVSEDTKELLEETFEGLRNIVEFRLEGFRELKSLSNVVFRPLRNLERLVLVGFGAHGLTYAELGAALYELSGTPLRRIVMHEIHSIENVDKIANITALFRLRNVTIRELIFSNNIISGMSGQLSKALPDLSYLCIGTNAHYYAAVKVLLDCWLFLRHLTNMTVYAVPVPDSVNILPCRGLIPELDHSFMNITVTLLKHRETTCYQRVKFPLPGGLKRLTLHQVMLTADWHSKYNPICFEHDNNVEYLNLAGSVLPANSTQITGLVNLKYLDLQNTGIDTLSDEFLLNFPKLETLNLVQLSTGESMQQINSSFFGNCPTLKEIHLGECQLTTIPSDAFVLLPVLETLNLSSNFLQTFDADLSSSGNLSHLNLSGNAISTMSEGVLAELSRIAKLRLQAGEMLTVDLIGNKLSCLCNSTHFVRQLQLWVIKQQVNVPGFEEYTCLYPNGSVLAMSQVDVDQSETQCSVLSKVKNGSDCPCDDDLRRRLELVRFSLYGYVCRNYDGKLLPMGIHSLPSCTDFFRTAVFIAPVVAGGVLALSLVITLIVLYRYRKSKPVHRIIERLGMHRIVRLGIQHVLAQNREDPSSFNHDVFLYIQDDDQGAAQRRFDVELSPHRHVLRHDDFSVGLKLETLLENVQTCHWLVPVLSQNFVDDGECCDFIARAQYTRPHAIVPVVWTPFHTDDLTINSLLDTGEPITWPGEQASDMDKAAFWKTLLERTESENGKTVMHDKLNKM